MFLCLLAIALAQDPPLPERPPVSEERPILQSFHGSLSARHRSRWTTHESDADLYEYLNLSLGDPDRETVTAALSARFAEDLDGERDVDGAFAFDSIDDTYQRGSTARLLTAYVDIHRVDDRMRWRFGRQVFEELPEMLPVDGGSILYTVEPVTAVVFAGKPANAYETSNSGDDTFGGWIEAQPWRRGRIRAEWLHLEDETLFGAFADDLVGLTLEQGAGSWNAWLRYTALESENRDASLRLSGAVPDWDLAAQFQGTWLFERQHAQSYAIDPYALFLLDLEPAAMVTARLSKALGTRFAVEGSLAARRFVGGGGESEYNHEFLRWTLSPRADRWPHERLSFSFSLDYWRSTADDFWTAGGDVSWRALDAITLSAGTSFALWSIDSLTGEERERVRTWQASAKWRVRPGTTLEVRLSSERSDLDTFTTFDVGVRHAW